MKKNLKFLAPISLKKIHCFSVLFFQFHWINFSDASRLSVIPFFVVLTNLVLLCFSCMARPSAKIRPPKKKYEPVLPSHFSLCCVWMRWKTTSDCFLFFTCFSPRPICPRRCAAIRTTMRLWFVWSRFAWHCSSTMRRLRCLVSMCATTRRTPRSCIFTRSWWRSAAGRTRLLFTWTKYPGKEVVSTSEMPGAVHKVSRPTHCKRVEV